MKTSVGSTIREARKSCGKTAQQVAKECGRSQANISKIERGEALPRSQEFIQALAFSVGLDWVDLAQMVDDERRTKTFMPEVNAYKAEPRRHKQIENEAHQTAKRLYELQTQTGHFIPVITSQQDAIRASHKLGFRFWFTTYPWAQRDTPEGRVIMRSGDLFMELREDVAQRAREGHGRARFTAAHELGHLILHRNELIEGVGANRVTKYEDSSHNTEWPSHLRIYTSADWQANVFASAFLMPLEGVRAFLASQRADYFQAQDIAQHFKVSLQAARIRMDKIIPRLAKQAQNGERG